MDLGASLYRDDLVDIFDVAISRALLLRRPEQNAGRIRLERHLSEDRAGEAQGAQREGGFRVIHSIAGVKDTLWIIGARGGIGICPTPSQGLQDRRNSRSAPSIAACMPNGRMK